jgi:hypothetical protein
MQIRINSHQSVDSSHLLDTIVIGTGQWLNGPGADKKPKSDAWDKCPWGAETRAAWSSDNEFRHELENSEGPRCPKSREPPCGA